MRRRRLAATKTSPNRPSLLPWDTVTRSALLSWRRIIAVIAACAVFLLLSRSSPSLAADRPTLAGVWSESILTERWNIGQWGTACGPRPVSRDMPGGQATVVEEGAELVITSADRTFRTAACYETMPGLVQSSHSVTQRSWQTRCVSAPGDPRQTTLVTNLTATDTTMSLDETGAYQFRVSGQNCTASARRSRSYRLVLRQGEVPSSTAPPAVTPEATATAAGTTPAPPLTAPGAPAPTPFSRPSTAGKCAEPGEPARLEVTPVRKLLRPGDRFTFRTQAFDASGCPVPPKANWAVATAGARVAVSPGGTVTVADDAEDGIVEMTVSFAGKAAKVRVEVATPARYEALLSTSSVNDAGEGNEPAATIVASGSLSANSAVAQDGARARKTTFVVIIGTLALGLAALGFLLMRRSVATPTATPDDTPEPIAYIAAPAGGAGGALGRPFGGRALLCPSCRGEFSAGTTFCPRDGNRLVEGPTAAPGGATALAGGICPTCGRGYDPGVRTCPVHGDELVPAAAYRPRATPAPVPERGKICPSCGGRYGGEATFCGKDGTALVLVN
jgi:hypothetical protein